MNHINDNESLYKEVILDHYQNPHNFGELDGVDREAESNNPLCGDQLKLQVVMSGDTIQEVRFSGQGCAISMASASMFTDTIKGMKFADLQKLEPEDVIKMLDIELTPIRLKCALLVLEVAQKL